jgi:acetolactate synthase-1/2/3 large subunit
LIVEAKRPVLYVGGGVIKAGASAQLMELAALTGIPVVTTLMARGAFPDSHPQHLGMPGMHGTVAAVTALQKSDLLITLGARFDDRVTGKVDTFAPDAKVIHADVDPAEISKNRVADVPIVGDARDVIADLTAAVRAEHEAGRIGDYEAWWSRVNGWRETYPLGYTEAPDGELSPQYAIQRLGAIAGPEAVYAAGVGQHQMWAAQFIKYENPKTWLNSGGLGTMGFAVPAAMGAKVGRPDATVWAIDGDGCFQMNNQRYSETNLQSKSIPDFVKLADAYGCHGIRVERADDVDAAIEKAMELNDAPVVVEFVVHEDAMVWPMVPAGTSNDDILAARDAAPVWDRED